MIGIGIKLSKRILSAIQSAPSSVWILALGAWNDNGVWDDSANWID